MSRFLAGKEKAIPRDKPLPFGWQQVVDDEGKVTYLDTVNNRTTFTDPRLAYAVERNLLDEELDEDGTGGGVGGGSKHSFRQRFDACSTAAQVLHGVDLSGKVAIVTGQI
jgi:WW domain-containing oxidoreductase